MGSVCRKILRNKHLDAVTGDTSLSRCLGVCDLTFMGIGSMVGSGIYVMTGVAAKQHAGPGIVLSFIIAAVVILMVMASYTELAASLHRTGSAYLYMYLTLGELPAFIVGFASLLVIILGGATNSRAWSAYVDSLFEDAVANFTMTHVASWDVGPPIARFPDFMAAGVIIAITLVVSAGAKCSSWFIGVFAVINVLILIFVSIVGFIYADLSNWTNPDTGGFLPFGWQGIIRGSAACFWAFSGFEVISMAVEEARNSHRDIPLSSVLVLVIVTILYVCTSASITLITSYVNIDAEAPLPSAFATRGLPWAHYIVALGPVCGLTTSMVTSLYGFSRMAYTMADDGLLFTAFSRVDSCSQVPLFSILFSGSCMALVALFFNIADIITFSVNITLINYALVAACVIMLRYKGSPNKELITVAGAEHRESEERVAGGLKHKYRRLQFIFRCQPGRWPNIALGAMVGCMLVVAMLLMLGGYKHWWTLVSALVFLLFMIILLLSMGAHHQVKRESQLQIPCVPLIPSISMFCCLLLLFANSTVSGWIGTLITLVIAILIYICYGYRHSK
uniref:Cationic amino acid transporter C-terminal domain-containing protein n=1 Tax=Capitella teleta TaxID=283909 RepID=X2B486_CAPTE